MTRFIFFCMAFVALSFAVVPVFTGISKEHDTILAAAVPSAAEDSPLSFEKIYEIAGATDATAEFDPSALNDITPAAGGDFVDAGFSSGFSGREDTALENAAITLPDNEGTSLE